MFKYAEHEKSGRECSRVEVFDVQNAELAEPPQDVRYGEVFIDVYADHVDRQLKAVVASPDGYVPYLEDRREPPRPMEGPGNGDKPRLVDHIVTHQAAPKDRFDARSFSVYFFGRWLRLPICVDRSQFTVYLADYSDPATTVWSLGNASSCAPSYDTSTRFTHIMVLRKAEE